jgi:integrase/recombinase XerD
MSEITLTSAITKYLTNRQTSFLSDTTLDSYSRTLSSFASYVGADKPVVSITPSLLDDWRTERSAQVSLPSLNLFITHLRGFFAFCTKMDYVDKNPCTSFLNIDHRKVRQQTKNTKDHVITETDLRNVFHNNHPANMYRAAILRNRAICGLFLTSGMRVSSLCDLEMRDLHFEEGYIHLRDAKGGKDFDVLFADVAQIALKTYLESLGSDNLSKPSSPVFGTSQSAYNAPYTRNAMTELVCRAIKGFTGSDGFRAHSLRHSCATILARNGMLQTDVSLLLGHSDGTAPTVTVGYIQEDNTSQRKQANGIFNRIVRK